MLKHAGTVVKTIGIFCGVLIRELLGRAENFGEIPLSEEELRSYGTGEWYYGENGTGHWKDQRSGETSGADSAFSSFSVYQEYRSQFLKNPTSPSWPKAGAASPSPRWRQEWYCPCGGMTGW